MGEETLQQLGTLQLEETLQQLGRLQLEVTLQQLGRLQLEETLQQLGRLQLEETLQQLRRLQLVETSQVGQARSSRIQPLFHQTNVLTSQRTSTGNDSRLSSTWVSATWPASVGTQGWVEECCKCMKAKIHHTTTTTLATKPWYHYENWGK